MCFRYLVKELSEGLVALPLVANFGGGDAAGARADVGRAVLLARVVQVAGLGRVQAVVLPSHRRLACRPLGRRRSKSGRGREFDIGAVVKLSARLAKKKTIA